MAPASSCVRPLATGVTLSAASKTAKNPITRLAEMAAVDLLYIAAVFGHSRHCRNHMQSIEVTLGCCTLWCISKLASCDSRAVSAKPASVLHDCWCILCFQAEDGPKLLDCLSSHTQLLLRQLWLMHHLHTSQYQTINLLIRAACCFACDKPQIHDLCSQPEMCMT